MASRLQSRVKRLEKRMPTGAVGGVLMDTSSGYRGNGRGYATGEQLPFRLDEFKGTYVYSTDFARDRLCDHTVNAATVPMWATTPAPAAAGPCHRRGVNHGSCTQGFALGAHEPSGQIPPDNLRSVAITRSHPTQRKAQLDSSRFWARSRPVSTRVRSASAACAGSAWFGYQRVPARLSRPLATEA